MFVAATVAIIAILVVAILYSAVRILREYERGVVFTLGRYTGTKGAGIFPACTAGAADGAGRSSGRR
jgi:regulator of protease activity HflC (stomatin/prohibitin superfamily)